MSTEETSLHPHGHAADLAPEPDTTTGGFYVMVMLGTIAFVGVAWLATSNLYRSMVVSEQLAVTRIYTSSPAQRALSAHAEAAARYGRVEVEEGSFRYHVPTSDAAALLLADPSALAGSASVPASSSSTEAAAPVEQLPELPEAEAVLTAAEQEVARRAAAAEAGAEGEADAGNPNQNTP